MVGALPYDGLASLHHPFFWVGTTILALFLSPWGSQQSKVTMGPVDHVPYHSSDPSGGFVVFGHHIIFVLIRPIHLR